MNAERLIALYERVADAPNTVPRLRRFILDLAVRGKLVHQAVDDESASELYQKTSDLVARPITANGSLRQSLPVKMDAVPFETPKSWRWFRIGQLGITQTGSTPPKGHEDYYGTDLPFIRPGDIYLDHVDYSGLGLSQAGVQATGRSAPEGSLLMVCIGTVGKCQIVDRLVSFNQQINSLTPFSGTLPKYILSACRSHYFQAAASAASARTTIAILNKGNWEKLAIPIPPLAEQRRIVAKVDELMALLDRLEAAQTAASATRARLLEALLHEALEDSDTNSAEAV
jgi:type I restriction enzyme S subunit